MVLQSSGKISLKDIQIEFNGVVPIKFSDYYRNNASGYTSSISGISNTGSTLNISQFYGKAYVPPIPVQTVFTGTYTTLMDQITTEIYGYETSYEWMTGCSATNLTRTGLSTFNNINSEDRNREILIYYPHLILQAKAGDTIKFSINIYVSYYYLEIIFGYVNFGAGYIQIGTPLETLTMGSHTLEITYIIPPETPVGNYALGAIMHDITNTTFRSGNCYSLHII